MSRKRDNRDEKNVGCVIAATVGVFVLTIVIMIFQSIPVVLPPLFLIAFLINYLLWRNNDKINAVNLRFWLDESEKKRFIELADALNYFRRKKQMQKMQQSMRGYGLIKMAVYLREVIGGRNCRGQ